MATVQSFRPYRYAPSVGPLSNLVTQPYDKISPAMRTRYLSLCPYNLVRIILGERFDSDDDAANVYTRAADYLRDWISQGVLRQDAEPAFYPYFQEFTDPDSGERLTRKGFIGLGSLEEYSAGIVHRHEQTLSGPKKDRSELLRSTRAHFGQIFMLYPDPQNAVDQILDEAVTQTPLGEVTDEYGALHRLWKLSDPTLLSRIQQLMADKKLVIADGHHRYETALAYSKENRSPAAQRVMMTFVNMHSPGLRILATHRLVSGLANFDARRLLEQLADAGKVETLPDAERFKTRFAVARPEAITIGVAITGERAIHLLEAPRAKGELDVPFLHSRILEGMLGVGAEAVRDEKYLQYVRGIDAALDAADKGQAQVAFLLRPTTVEQVADVSFSGGVMPQKSTDFFPKLLSGLTVYKLD